jgi:AcrR family transcriptional regulator
MATARRVGAETSKTRDRLLDCVERLMIDNGYAAVTYRAVAAKADVTAGLVQYYFPTLDGIFVAAVRRRADANLERLTAVLEQRPHEPLRVMWEFSREEATAALMTEFTALGNHRDSIREVIAEVTEAVRKAQLDALEARWGETGPPGAGLSTGALLFLLAGIPKLINLEAGIGVTTTHAEVMETFERYLELVEPRTPERPARKNAPQRTRAT